MLISCELPFYNFKTTPTGSNCNEHPKLQFKKNRLTEFGFLKYPIICRKYYATCIICYCFKKNSLPLFLYNILLFKNCNNVLSHKKLKSVVQKRHPLPRNLQLRGLNSKFVNLLINMQFQTHLSFSKTVNLFQLMLNARVRYA